MMLLMLSIILSTVSSKAILSGKQVDIYSGIRWRQNLSGQNLTITNYNDCNRTIPISDIIYIDQDEISKCQDTSFYRLFITNYLDILPLFENKTRFLLINPHQKYYFPVMFFKIRNLDFVKQLINNKPVSIDILQLRYSEDYLLLSSNSNSSSNSKSFSFVTDQNVWFDVIEDLGFKIYFICCQVFFGINLIITMRKLKQVIGKEASFYKLVILFPLILASITGIITSYDITGIYGIFNNIFGRVIFTIGTPILLFSFLTMSFLWLDTFATIQSSLNFKARVPFLVKYKFMRFIILFICVLLLVSDITMALLENLGLTDANFSILPSLFGVLLLTIVFISNLVLTFSLRKLKNEQTNINSFKMFMAKIHPYKIISSLTHDSKKTTDTEKTIESRKTADTEKTTEIKKAPTDAHTKITKIIDKVVRTYYLLKKVNVCIFFWIALEVSTGLNISSISPLHYKVIIGSIVAVYICVMSLLQNVLSILMS